MRKMILVTGYLIFALSASISAAPGDLDPTFGIGGKVITNFNRVDYAFAVALQLDGKLIVAGSSFNTAAPEFLIIRYHGDGSLDTSFGNGGMVVTDFGAQDYALAVALQPDGRIVAAGLSQNSSIGNIVLARYNADGSLDSTFGNGGKVTTDINGQYERADALVLQADGKLVAAGFTCAIGVRCTFALFRYNSNGSLDPTFGSGGIVTTNFGGQGDAAYALALLANGKIVAAGYAYDANSDFALARYNSNGTLDTTFGTGGIVTTDFGDFESAGNVVIQPDGKIVAAGTSGDGDFDNDAKKFSLARYKADGTLDATFGSGGKVITDFGFTGHSGLALQEDGKIVGAGTVRIFNENSWARENFALVRYNTNGTLDTTFGSGGIVTTGFDVRFSASGGTVIQPDGKIVVAGYTIHENNNSDLALARYVLDVPCPNLIDCADFFVRQHYLDFLTREPDAAGLAFWTSEINFCGSDVQCVEAKRINVSAAFFLSIEFQQTGYLAFRAHKTAFGDLAGKPVPITRAEMLQDMQTLASGVVVNADGWQVTLEQNKQTYFAQLVASSRFTALYPLSMTPEQYVDALNANAGGALSPAERNALVAELSGGAKTRAQALRVVAEDEDFLRAEFNRAFVLMQYFGYLRRNPDDPPDSHFAGYNFWLAKLDQFQGNYIEAEMVKAFINSNEYRQRFAQP